MLKYSIVDFGLKKKQQKKKEIKGEDSGLAVVS